MKFEKSCYDTHKDTRYSDSSQYDEVCNVCGLTDSFYGKKNMNNTPCYGYKQVWVKSGEL